MEKNARVLTLLAIVSACNASASANPARNYAYTITVGSNKADYATITGAIAAMKKKEPDENHPGLIKVRPGKYAECLGSSTYGDDTLWLPKHCDLTGTGDNIDDVIIEHPAGTVVNAFTIIGAGDNIISNLKIYSNRSARNGIYLFDNCTLTNCIVDTVHVSVSGEQNLTVSDCVLKSMYGACILAEGTFSISRSTLQPRGASSFLEVPTGILASGPGSISDVAISSTVESSYIYDGAGLTGIEIKTTADEVVNISNTTINLQLTTKYNPNETAVLRVCGIMNGSRWFEPKDNYKGHTVVRDCTINVTGIEGADGAAIMVDGINIRGGGKIDVLGKTTITTSRKSGSFSEKGQEYSLNNENGTLAVDVNNISYDKALTNGTISACNVNLPVNNYWQNKLAERQKHLIYCPADMNSSGEKETSGMPSYVQWMQGSSESIAEGEDGGQMLLDGTVYVNSDITTNQIWTANNIYCITAHVHVQALLVIEPGTLIRFSSNGALFVNNWGTLISCGTPDNMILYTSTSGSGWGDYYCAIYIESTASPATKVTYSYVECAMAAIVINDIQLDSPLENNCLFYNYWGIYEYGTHHTDIMNNQTFCSNSSGIEIYMRSEEGLADANSVITITNNTCDYYQANGIVVHGAADENDAGQVTLVNNIVSESSSYGLKLVDGYVYAMVFNTGYYGNSANKNWDFNEYNPVVASEFPYIEGPGYFEVCCLDQSCPFINAGLEYIDETSLIGQTTDINGLPDGNKIDIGYHFPNWQYSNAGQSDYDAGDFDENCIIDFRDFAILADGWGQTYDVNNLAQMCSNWLLIGGPEPNITPIILGDSNSGCVGISAGEFPLNTNRIAVLDDGQYIGTLYGFENEALALNTSASGGQEHHLKLISISKTGHITCSNIAAVALPCPLKYYIIPSDYEAGKAVYFAGFNPNGGDISVELLADGGISVWSQVYNGTSFSGCIPAALTSQHYLDCVTASVSPQPAPIKKRVYPKIRLKDIDPATEALIIQPDLWIDFAGTDMLNQVERAFIQNGIKFKLLGWAYGTSYNIAAYSWLCPNIRYLYVFSHGGYQYDKNGGVLRTRVLLADGTSVSVKRNDFPLYQWPSWCGELELDLEYSPVLSWAAMGFHSLEFAYFNCCYTGRLKINAYNQLVEGQPGQGGVFDLPHSDMSYALGMADTNRDCALQGWYDKPWFALGGVSPFNKWTRDEWSNLALGLPAGNLYTAIQYAISQQTEFTDPNAPANSSRLRGRGTLEAIGLNDE